MTRVRVSHKSQRINAFARPKSRVNLFGARKHFLWQIYGTFINYCRPASEIGSHSPKREKNRHQKFRTGGPFPGWQFRQDVTDKNDNEKQDASRERNFRVSGGVGK